MNARSGLRDSGVMSLVVSFKFYKVLNPHCKWSKYKQGTSVKERNRWDLNPGVSDSGLWSPHSAGVTVTHHLRSWEARQTVGLHHQLSHPKGGGISGEPDFVALSFFFH